MNKHTVESLEFWAALRNVDLTLETDSQDIQSTAEYCGIDTSEYIGLLVNAANGDINHVWGIRGKFSNHYFTATTIYDDSRTELIYSAVQRNHEIRKPITVYCAMAGLHGYMPNYRDFSLDLDSAVDSLQFVHDFGRDKRRELKRNLYLDLNLARYGNEYCEIVANTPEYFDLTPQDIDDIRNGNFDSGI